MVDLLQSSTRNRFQTAVWAVKLGFLFIGIVSTVLLLMLAVPYSVNAILSAIPRLWISLRSWLAPPYLYIVVNFIIIIIAASSSFQQKHWRKNSEEVVVEAEKQKRNDLGSDSSSLASDHRKTSMYIWPDMEEIPQDTIEKALVSVEKSLETCFDVSWLTDFDEKTTPDLSVSSRFDARKLSETSRRIDGSEAAAAPQKATKSLGLTKPKKQDDDDDDTMDATWKMITEGKGKPLTRQLKKSETWDVPPRVNDPKSELDSSSGVTNRKELRKLETFNDASSSSATLMRGGGGGGLRREISLSHDELNHRVEAFIKKFKLQRQESDNRYMEMVNRGVY
ncbi:uncharacterized protein LOC122645537 [Telopea speciosissima]|uniref:uncharacterized protein LOC122645537 n=1 Tax=Telopea speciosissima TaxID=54955 RepID=UPI001CC6A074|nr:uncharacterized protein LOC122645537 [Telopea speciosissima]